MFLACVHQMRRWARLSVRAKTKGSPADQWEQRKPLLDGMVLSSLCPGPETRKYRPRTAVVGMLATRITARKTETCSHLKTRSCGCPVARGDAPVDMIRIRCAGVHDPVSHQSTCHLKVPN